MPKYSAELNVQKLISLLKQFKIRKIIANPGMKNLPFVASVQFDPFFQVYSCVDERSAAYMACGMAVESGEPVVLSCTGATASRNYISALTEAYYRHIPILAVTSMSYPGEIGHLVPQIIDRSQQMNDIVYKSVEIQSIRCAKDDWDVTVKLNDALLTLFRGNGGPAHINLICENFKDFDGELATAKRIQRITPHDDFPQIDVKSIGIFVGSHKAWTESLTEAVDNFCEKYNSVVVCDHTSNYIGKYAVHAAIYARQRIEHKLLSFDLLIHIGDISGSYIGFSAKCVWRVNLDGELRDPFKKLTAVFEMDEEAFFSYYNSRKKGMNTSLFAKFSGEIDSIRSSIPDLPFSNAWIAQQTGEKLPSNAILHLGILNSLRHWNLFHVRKDILCYANTGGFGIDGILSTAIGAALASPDKTVFVVLGDLALFYDMNSMGNRHVPNNIRIILVNNGRGIEFRNYGHPSSVFGDDADAFMAAAGHFGNQSRTLIKHYAEDLGYSYLCANNKEEYKQVMDGFVSPSANDKPIILECFTKTEDESEALKLMSNIIEPTKPTTSAANTAKHAIAKMIGKKGVKAIKRLLK